MNTKKILIVPQALSYPVADILEELNVWNSFEMVVVRDEDYDEAVALLKSNLPEVNRLRELQVNGSN